MKKEALSRRLFGKGEITMSRAFETRCIHGREDSRLNDAFRAVSFPIYQTATFSHIETGHNGSGFDYTRESNPTRTHTEEAVAAVESARHAIGFSSGMAAISCFFELFGRGDHVVCSEDLYGGVFRLHRLVSEKNGVGITYADTSDPDELAAAIRPETKAVYLETPTNPMMHITDIRRAAELAHSRGALLAVDNTFLSPRFQNPLLLGADIVIHSASKFLSGHNDTVAGFICLNDDRLAEELRLLAKTTGASLSPFDSFLVERGIKTLAVRMERQQENALALAEVLNGHPRVRDVCYAGLAAHKGYELNLSQASGFGSMISLHTDTPETALGVLHRVRLFTFAESLGGTESLVTYPLVQTHSDVPQQLKDKLGIDGTLLRISVGLENSDDLIRDITQALEG